MNPYERLLQSGPRMGGYPSNPSSTPNSSSANGTRDPSAAKPPSATANAKRLPPQKKVKPAISFQVRPRFRFDLPDPPMHPKMLLGRLSTASYARPLVSDLERDFRPPAIPADPIHALHANLLVQPTRPRKPDRHRNPANSAPLPDLSVNDEVLLRSLLHARTAMSPILNGKPGLDGRRSSASGPGGTGRGGSVGGRPRTAAGAQLNEMTAPWMRRMSYDEYLVGSPNVGRVAVAPVKERTLQASRRVVEDTPASRERRRAALAQTFVTIRRRPVHPDTRRGHLKPVRVSPIIPDFEWLGANLIAFEFENEESLTTEGRAKKGGKKVEESVCSMATISLSDSTAPRKPHEPPKKFLACYTPTDATLGKRKRGSGNGDDELNEEEDDDKKGGLKKIKFCGKEQYEWFGEFAIKESKFGASKSAKVGRSCFAVSEVKSNDGTKSVACMSKIATSWILSKRPFVEGTQRLGKEGLKLTRDVNGKPVRMSDKKALISGQQS